jgi:hypothetical protein
MKASSEKKLKRVNRLSKDYVMKDWCLALDIDAFGRTV